MWQLIVRYAGTKAAAATLPDDVHTDVRQEPPDPRFRAPYTRATPGLIMEFEREFNIAAPQETPYR